MRGVKIVSRDINRTSVLCVASNVDHITNTVEICCLPVVLCGGGGMRGGGGGGGSGYVDSPSNPLLVSDSLLQFFPAFVLVLCCIILMSFRGSFYGVIILHCHVILVKFSW